MSKHSPNSTSAPKPTSFALDYHTRQFFDPTEWEGDVESRFFLDTPGLIGRKFQGRIVHLCSTHPVIVLQEVGGNSECTLLKRTPYPLKLEEAETSNRPEHWGEWLGVAKKPRPSGCPLPILPNLSANSGLSRLHFDALSGFGAQVLSQGHGYLFDLRDVESAEKRHYPWFDLAEFVGEDGMRSLFEMDAAQFHAALDAMFRDEGGALRQTLRFYELSDDERAREVFGCEYGTLKRTLEGLRLALTVALGPGGVLEGSLRASWHPWHHNQSEAVSLNTQSHWWEDIPAPQVLAHLMDRVCAATGCHLRLEQVGENGALESGVVNARTVAQEWANEFRVWSRSANGHEAMEAGVELREMLRKTG